MSDIAVTPHCQTHQLLSGLPFLPQSRKRPWTFSAESQWTSALCTWPWSEVDSALLLLLFHLVDSNVDILEGRTTCFWFIVFVERDNECWWPKHQRTIEPVQTVAGLPMWLVAGLSINDIINVLFFFMNASLNHPPERVTDTQIGIIPATGGVCDKSSQGKQLRFNDNWLPVWQQAEALNPLTSCPILTPGGDREARWHMTPSSQLKVVAEPRKQRGMMHSHRLLRSYSVCLVLL